MQKKIYVVGMFDDDTAGKVQTAVAAVAGVTNVVANCEKSQVLVDYDDASQEDAINGAISSDLNQIKIAKSHVKLKNGPTADLEVDITGIGEYLNTNQIQKVKITLKSDISSLPIEQVPDVWPVATGPDAHAWVKRNLSDGMVEKAIFTLYFTGDELTDLYGEIPVKNITVRYLNEMTPVKGLNGIVQLWPNRVLINGKEGNVGHLKLTAAEVDLTGLDTSISHAKINLDIRGPVEEALALIAEKPLEFPQMFGLNPSETAGQATIKASLAFPLIDNLGTKQVLADVKADIVDGVFPTPLPGQNLSDGKLNLTVDNQKLIVQGEVSIMNIPLNIKWEESFTATRQTDIHSQYQIQANVPSDRLKVLIPEIESYIEGEVAVNSDIKIPVSQDISAKVNADLTNAHVRLFPISIDKPAAAKATLTTDINFFPKTNRGEFKFDMSGFLDLEKQQPFTLAGTVSKYSIDEKSRKRNPNSPNSRYLANKDGDYIRVDIEKIDTPNNSLKGAVGWSNTGALYVQMMGSLWDLSDVYNRPKTLAPEVETETETKTEEKPTQWFSDIYLNIDVNKLILDKEKPLTAVSITGEKKNNVWNSLSLKAKGTEQMTLSLNPQNQQFRGGTSDFGDLLWRLGITKDIIGGKLKIKSTQQKEGGFEGTIKVQNFSLKDPGFLVQAFSILGIVDAITGDDLKFSTAVIPFKTKYQPTLTAQLEDAYMSGRNLGITFVGEASLDKLALNGSVIPAYLINSLPGKIPLIGALFKDSDGGGLIGAKYEIIGTPTNPSINFKPLHSIAPGILGKLFQ